MKDRIIRLSKASWIEFVKRLPYIGLLLVALVLFQGFKTGQDVAENIKLTKENSEVTKQVAQDSKQLLEQITQQNELLKTLGEANKHLSEQNIRLADQSIRYQQCTFGLFAKYTRDRQPIKTFNLDVCAAENVIFGQGLTTEGNPGFESQGQQPAPQEPQQPGGSGDNRNQPKKDKQSLANRVFGLLGRVINNII